MTTPLRCAPPRLRPRASASALLVALAACHAPTRPYLDMPPPTEAQGVRVELQGLVRRTTKLLGLYGEVENTNGRRVETCSIRYQVLDQWGDRVARTEARLGPLEPGEKRGFEARFEESNVTSAATVLAGQLHVTFAD